MTYNLLIVLDVFDIETLVPTIIGMVVSVFSILLLLYENRKRQKEKRQYKRASSKYDEINSLYTLLNVRFKELDKKHNYIETENERLKVQNKILNQIINCATNKALHDEKIFQESMKGLATELRRIFKSEYCAIGKIVGNAVEDFVVSFDEYENESLRQNQIKYSRIVRRVDINYNVPQFSDSELRQKKLNFAV